MAFDIKKWLMEDMKFSDAEATEMMPRFTPERVGVIEKNIGLSSANASANAEVAKLQSDLKAANDKLNAEMAEWATLTTAEKAEATALRASLEAAQVRTVQLESRLTTLATQHGVDPKALLEGAAIVPEVKKPDVPAVDPSKFVDVERFGTTVGYALDLPAQIDYIQREHHKLTGEYIDARDLVREIKQNAGKKDGVVDPVALWEAKYQIPAKRDAKAKADFDKQISDAEARGEERARSSAALPNATSPGRHAPVFGSKGADGTVQPRTSALKRPQPGQTVNAAVSAFQTHKYRSKAS